MVDFGWATEGKEVVSAFVDQVNGKTFLITGPSKAGIGGETALSLARGSPEQLLLLGRSLEKIQPIIDEIHSINPSVKLRFIEVHLDSINSVRNAAQKILDDPEVKKVDVVINNAGIMACPYGATVDGIELQFGTNHISHFLLTNLLMPKILAAGPGARVVNVSSYGNIFGNVNFEDPNFDNGKSYVPFEAYAQGKTANILMAVSLREKLGNKGVKAYALHPGSIVTSLQRHLKQDAMADAMALHAEHGITLPQRKSLQQGCSTSLVAALDPELENHEGIFLNDCRLVTDSWTLAPHSVDKDNARKCWELSERLVGQKFDY